MVHSVLAAARRIDAWLQSALNNGVAFVARDAVAPGEIQEYLRTEAYRTLGRDADGTTRAANSYRIELSGDDFDALRHNDPELCRELEQQMARFIRNNRWVTAGAVSVTISAVDGLHKGQFHSRSAVTEDAVAHSGFVDLRPGDDHPAPPVGVTPAKEVPMHQPFPAPQPDEWAATPGPAAAPAAANAPAAPTDPWADPDFEVPAAGTAPRPLDPHPMPPPAPLPTVTVAIRGVRRPFVVQPGTPAIIGRSPEADLVVDDPSVSRFHAEISVEGGTAILVDTRSSNGTSVNGMKVFNWELADGDVVQVGRTLLDVRIS